MDCRAEAYPGVWDLILKKNIKRQDGCESLFNKVDKPENDKSERFVEG